MMLDLGPDSYTRAATHRLVPCLVSFVSVVCCQLLLYFIARACPAFSILLILLLSGWFSPLSQSGVKIFINVFIVFNGLVFFVYEAFTLLVVSALGSSCRRLAGVSASALAFVVFSILFLWGFYLLSIQKGTSLLNNVVLNLQFLFLLAGLSRIFISDPGVVATECFCVEKPFQNGLPKDAFIGRVRYCKTCKRHIKGFDHHCPAFGNCIGEDNHFFFMILVFSFVIAETSYVIWSRKFIQRFQNSSSLSVMSSVQLTFGISTMVFCLVQLLWQVVFLAWHIFCICINCKTDEWVNWRKYPEFHEVILPSLEGHATPEIKFINPYDNGVLMNVLEFLGFGEKRPPPLQF